MKTKRTIPHGLPPSWLPDWKDQSAYTHEDYTPRLWAWEFLRRNQEYQADYQQWVDSEYSRELEHKLSEKWHVAHLNDPAGDSVVMVSSEVDADAMPPLFLDFERESNIPPDGLAGCRILLRYGPGSPTDESRQFFVRFDVRYPLDRQLADVTYFYNARRTGLKEFDLLDAVNPAGPQLRKLPKYLRVFDAVWCDVQHKDIAETLFPGCTWDPPQGRYPKRIRNALKEARRLVQGGYRDLLLWAT